MKYDFLNKEALYRECSELFLVRVIEQTEDDWGIKLRLKVLENKIANIDTCDIEYHTWSQLWDEFNISGAWDIQSYENEIFTLIYVTVKLNFRRSAIDAFRREEKDWWKLWNHHKNTDGIHSWFYEDGTLTIIGEGDMKNYKKILQTAMG